MKARLKLLQTTSIAAVAMLALAARADNLDLIGARLLGVATNADGTGIRVAQCEGGGTNFEVNPLAVGQSSNLFSYISTLGTTNNFPNSVGAETQHADLVGAIFYGMVGFGVATNVAHVDNWDADEFVQIVEQDLGLITNYTCTLPATNIDDPVVNSSFTFGQVPTNEQKAADSAYDNYAAQYNTLFISSANNGGTVSPPGTAYNCISVGAYNGSSSTGPTADNGRCKPDICAPFYFDSPDERGTSFATPLVSGSAAVLMQVALRGDGGSDTNSASDIRTIKALLLNGAVKPANWTNANSSPLDARYGVGMVNVFNSYEQLAGGKKANIETTTVSINAAHPPGGATGTESVLSGWDFAAVTSDFSHDAINHYYFNVTNGIAAQVEATATLVWNRQLNQSGINNLNLFLYNCSNSNLVACSTSLVDNVEHVFVPRLAPGRYDLQVWKAGGIHMVSSVENYALAWAFVAPRLAATESGGIATATWPGYPAGFQLQSALNLIGSVWTTNNLAFPTFTNGMNTVQIPATNGVQFFRLRQPGF